MVAGWSEGSKVWWLLLIPVLSADLHNAQHAAPQCDLVLNLFLMPQQRKIEFQ